MTMTITATTTTMTTTIMTIFIYDDNDHWWNTYSSSVWALLSEWVSQWESRCIVLQYFFGMDKSRSTLLVEHRRFLRTGHPGIMVLQFTGLLRGTIKPCQLVFVMFMISLLYPSTSNIQESVHMIPDDIHLRRNGMLYRRLQRNSFHRPTGIGKRKQRVRSPNMFLNSVCLVSMYY